MYKILFRPFSSFASRQLPIVAAGTHLCILFDIPLHSVFSIQSRGFPEAAPEGRILGAFLQSAVISQDAMIHVGYILPHTSLTHTPYSSTSDESDAF